MLLDVLRQVHNHASNRSETIYTIEKLMQRTGIDAKGVGYRPNDSFLQAKVYDASQETCDYPSTAEQRYKPVVYESMIKRRE